MFWWCVMWLLLNASPCAWCNRSKRPSMCCRSDLHGTCQPLHLLLELQVLLLSLVLVGLQSSLHFLTSLVVLVQSVHFLFQDVFAASGCSDRLLRSEQFFTQLLYLRLSKSRERGTYFISWILKQHTWQTKRKQGEKSGIVWPVCGFMCQLYT